jgi:hypothetical protein
MRSRLGGASELEANGPNIAKWLVYDAEGCGRVAPFESGHLNQAALGVDKGECRSEFESGKGGDTRKAADHRGDNKHCAQVGYARRFPPCSGFTMPSKLLHLVRKNSGVAGGLQPVVGFIGKICTSTFMPCLPPAGCSVAWGPTANNLIGALAGLFCFSRTPA